MGWDAERRVAAARRAFAFSTCMPSTRDRPAPAPWPVPPAAVLMHGQFRHRMFELVARDGGGREFLRVFLHGRRLVGRRRHRDITGLDAPFRGALGSGHPLDEFYRRLLLLGRRALDNVKAAAAGRRAAPLLSIYHPGS